PISLLLAMKWIVCLLFGSIAAAAPAPNEASDPNSRLLNNILSYVEEEASPCDDFFKYACGKYAGNHVDDPFTEIVQMLDHKVNQKLVQLMEELQHSSLAPGFNESSVEAKVLRFYLNCRDAPLSTRSAEHYLRLVTPGEGLPWPHLTANSTAWPQEQFRWTETLARLQRYGLRNVLVDAMLVQNWENSREFLIELSMPSFVGESEKLKGFLETFATLLIMGVPRKSVLPLTRKMRRLESAVMRLTEADGDEDQFMSVSQLQRVTGIEWRRFIEIVLGHEVSPDFSVQVKNLRYFQALKRLMDKSDSELVANYIMTRFVMYLMEDTMDSSDPIECIKDARRGMNIAMSLLYKERFLEGPTLQRYIHEIQQLFDQLRLKFMQMVAQNRLGLSIAQRRMVTKKAKDISLNIGNLPRSLDHRSFVSRYYESLRSTPGDPDYDREHLKLLAFRFQKLWSQLDKPAPSGDEYFYMEDSDTAMSSSPYYMMRENIIIVPHGNLQEPLFAPDSHDVFKYSLLGFVLAHELMHSVDGDGIHFDNRGNRHEIGYGILYSPRFEAGLECLNRNETEFLNERLADIAGLHIAYSAFFESKPEGHMELANTGMSQEKIFFLNMAQFFCGDADSTSFVDHDSDKLRLQQLLSGFAPFKRAFSCTRDRRPPNDLCRLW
ncbi:hypothetical protein KR009_003715, partial [Drosophila setifemur]